MERKVPRAAAAHLMAELRLRLGETMKAIAEELAPQAESLSEAEFQRRWENALERACADVNEEFERRLAELEVEGSA
jgi:hypothetical protein